MRRIRKTASWILLVAYLPLLVASSLHVHHDTADTDDGCLHCSGHFEMQHHHHGDCLFCHFLSLNYLGQNTHEQTVFLSFTDRCRIEIVERAEMVCFGTVRLRAPPAC